MRLGIKITMIMLLLTRSAWATHIIGGEMFYDHLGGDQYLITLELYRDCGPDNTQGTGFDFQATIGVFNSTGNFLFSVSLTDPGETTVPVDLNSPCMIAPPSVCVATTVYSGVVDLPPIPGGYHLSYQRCCRTPAIVNLDAPNSQGLTCTVKVPGVPNVVNSSPRFTEYPPIALCFGEDMAFDHSAFDPDGDELIYELCAPFIGGTSADPAPAIPTPPPYTEVDWAAGYSAAFPLDAAPPLTIDPATGELTVTPSLLGSFTVGVRVREMRNGVQLSEVIRDFKFVVVSCETDIVASIADLEAEEMFDCLTASFENTSINGGFWHWDFGVPNTLADTSDQFEPEWIYAESGTYTVTLIANPGWPCADTAQITITTPPAFGVFFDPPENVCVGSDQTFTAQGELPPGTIFQWTIPPEASAQDLAASQVIASFSAPGTHVIALNVSAEGCTDSYADSVVVHPYPIADFDSDHFICAKEQIVFEDLSTSTTPMTHHWDLGDGTIGTDPAPIHHYEEPGTYTVSHTVSTSEGCIAEDTEVKVAQVTVHPLPVAGFRVMPAQVSMHDAQVEVVDHAEGAMSWTYLIEDQQVHDPSFDHWFEDAGQVEVWQFVTSEHGCRDSTAVDVFITDHLFFAPNAFTPNGDGLNDLFAPMVKGARLYDLSIYDRYGREVFRTDDPKAAWDGSGLPQGMFTYKANIAEYGTHRQEYTGHVSLLR